MIVYEKGFYEGAFVKHRELQEKKKPEQPAQDKVSLEQKIIAKLFARSEDAFSDMEEAYGKLCSRLIGQILNQDQEDVKECMNDVYLGVWNTVPPERPQSLQAYICKIARNLALKRLEYYTSQKRHGTVLSLQEELDACLLPAKNDYDELELAEIMNQFLKTLDTENRALFVRRYWYADPIEELAADFGYSKNHVSVKLGRIRKKLKKHLEKEEIYI